MVKYISRISKVILSLKEIKCFILKKSFYATHIANVSFYQKGSFTNISFCIQGLLHWRISWILREKTGTQTSTCQKPHQPRPISRVQQPRDIILTPKCVTFTINVLEARLMPQRVNLVLHGTWSSTCAIGRPMWTVTLTGNWSRDVHKRGSSDPPKTYNQKSNS